MTRGRPSTSRSSKWAAKLATPPNDLDAVEVDLTSPSSDCTPPPMGFSVAVMQDGQMVYQRGVGLSDRAAGKVAHGESIYQTASVAKVFGGTLAKMLAEDPAVQLDLNAQVRTHLQAAGITLPFLHTYDYRDLLAHDACIEHYPEFPFNHGVHHASARDTVQQHPTFLSNDAYITAFVSIPTFPFWRFDVCTVGANGSQLDDDDDAFSDYSSAALTYAAAGFEQQTGQTINELIRDYFTVGANLPSLAVSDELETPPENYERSLSYISDAISSCGDTSRYCEYERPDSSWKVLGGGLEISAVDLARFGHMVESGQLVTDLTDLWAARNTGYALSWQASNWGGAARDFVQHFGDANGAATLIRIYPTENIVIAVMANTREAEGDDPPQSTGDRRAFAGEVFTALTTP